MCFIRVTDLTSVFKAKCKIPYTCGPLNFLFCPSPPTQLPSESVMVAGMCVMVGLKGQALVIVPWSWLSDTTACLLFTPGTPAWLTAPPAPLLHILYRGYIGV